jgi:hypothetical protein
MQEAVSFTQPGLGLRFTLPSKRATFIFAKPLGRGGCMVRQPAGVPNLQFAQIAMTPNQAIFGLPIRAY